MRHPEAHSCGGVKMAKIEVITKEPLDNYNTDDGELKFESQNGMVVIITKEMRMFFNQEYVISINVWVV